MAKGISAITGHLVSGRSGISGIAGISLVEIWPFGLIQFMAWPDTLTKTTELATIATGSDTTPSPGRAVTGANGALLRVEPLKWWLVCDCGQPKSWKALSCVVLDLSQSRTRLHISGPQAARLLSHVLPLDLSDTAFPEGCVASSAFHHVGVTLWRDAEGFNLFLPRSFAVSLYEILTATAVQYGLKIG